jgi:hypothetical protein
MRFALGVRELAAQHRLAAGSHATLDDRSKQNLEPPPEAEALTPLKVMLTWPDATRGAPPARVAGLADLAVLNDPSFPLVLSPSEPA